MMIPLTEARDAGRVRTMWEGREGIGKEREREEIEKRERERERESVGNSRNWWVSECGHTVRLMRPKGDMSAKYQGRWAVKVSGLRDTHTHTHTHTHKQTHNHTCLQSMKPDGRSKSRVSAVYRMRICACARVFM
jgi:hypothetical protein